MPLTLDDIDRYHRQLLLPEWGPAGQERIQAARVRIHGAGAAAAMCARYLAGAGIRPQPELPHLPELPLTKHAANPDRRSHATVSVVREDILEKGDQGGGGDQGEGSEGEEAWVVEVRGDREALGAAAALEVIKGILGLEWRAEVELVQVLHGGAGAP